MQVWIETLAKVRLAKEGWADGRQGGRGQVWGHQGGLEEAHKSGISQGQH